MTRVSQLEREALASCYPAVSHHLPDKYPLQGVPLTYSSLFLLLLFDDGVHRLAILWVLCCINFLYIHLNYGQTCQRLHIDRYEERSSLCRGGCFF